MKNEAQDAKAQGTYQLRLHMKSGIQRLPDPEISLRDSRDFVLNSELGRRSLENNEPKFAIFLCELIDAIYRLVQSCHLPEFTDHGLPHLCSLVDRISTWELTGGRRLASSISGDEAARLLLATLLHDIGMLSQNASDLPQELSSYKSKASAIDIATWVRQTHVDRLDLLANRLLSTRPAAELLASELFKDSIAIARAHQNWPWEWPIGRLSQGRNRGLAAVLAVADLLDEDAARCDTSTLLDHREGNSTNRAHWLRHVLTTDRIVVTGGSIVVNMIRLPRMTITSKPIFSALRNHFRLVSLYDNDLRALGAAISNITLTPSTGIPQSGHTAFDRWNEFPGFANEKSLVLHILKTFMPLAILDTPRCDPASLQQVRTASLEHVDLDIFDQCRGFDEPRSDVEETFLAIVGDLPKKRK